MKQDIYVAGGVLVRDGLFLVAQRRPGASYELLWEFPGGTKEEGETFQECLIREFQEELGIVIEVGDRAEYIVHEEPKRRLHLQLYWCRLVSGEPRTIECADFRWLPFNELRKLSFPPANTRFLETLARLEACGRIPA